MVETFTTWAPMAQINGSILNASETGQSKTIRMEENTQLVAKEFVHSHNKSARNWIFHKLWLRYTNLKTNS